VLAARQWRDYRARANRKSCARTSAFPLRRRGVE
jgi:hypothetical protein